MNYASQFIRKNSSTILTCLGVVGVVATSITTAKAVTKASQLLAEAEEVKGEELTNSEKFKTVLPFYIPPVLIGASTIVCIVGANILSKRQQASLASAYALLDASFKGYQGKLKELYGQDAHERILVEQAKDTYIKSSSFTIKCDLGADECSGETRLFYDDYGHRYFESTMEKVLAAEYHFNRNYVLRGHAYLNEFYEFLGLEPTEEGHNIGWIVMDDGSFWVDFNHIKAVMDDGLECYIIETPFAPSADIQEELGWQSY